MTTGAENECALNLTKNSRILSTWSETCPPIRKCSSRSGPACGKSTPGESARLREQGAILVDIREQDEVDQGIIPGAVHIPRGFLEMRIEETVRDRDTPLIVYCAGGVRSIFGAEALSDLGYRDVASMAGGFGGWKASGLPWRVPQTLTPDQRRRYSRHSADPGGRRGRPAQAARRQGSPGRRGRARLAGGALSRRRRSRARSGSSTPTSSTNRTCSARWSTPPTASACPRSNRPGSPSKHSTRT